jgi:hypothetical protein
MLCIEAVAVDSGVNHHERRTPLLTYRRFTAYSDVPWEAFNAFTLLRLCVELLLCNHHATLGGSSGTLCSSRAHPTDEWSEKQCFVSLTFVKPLSLNLCDIH